MTDTERKICEKIERLTVNRTKDSLLDDDEALRAIYDVENESQATEAPNQPNPLKSDSQRLKLGPQKLGLQNKSFVNQKLTQLKDDLNKDVNKILEQVKTLEANFTIELSRVQKETIDVVRNTGDRVIATLSDGPWAMLSDEVRFFVFSLVCLFGSFATRMFARCGSIW